MFSNRTRVLSGLLVLGAGLIVTFQNFDIVDWYNEETADDGEIVVEGRVGGFTSFISNFDLGISFDGWQAQPIARDADYDPEIVVEGKLPVPNQAPEFVDPNEIVVEAPRPCSEVKAGLAKRASELSDKRVVAIGDIHGRLTSGEIIDLISKAAGADTDACVFFEYPPDQGDMPGRYGKAESGVQALGMSTSRIDQAWNYYQRDGVDSFNERLDSFDVAAEKRTPEQNALMLNTINGRDALMANYINSAQSSCSKIIALVGAGHINHDFDDPYGEWGSGRQNLKDLLGSNLDTVDGSQLKSCDINQ